VSVNTLFQGCLELLVQHIEDVETLWGMPNLIKVLPHAVASSPPPPTPNLAPNRFQVVFWERNWEDQQVIC